LADREIAEYEERLGVKLPPEYRQFVTQVGHGGTGPFYGLFRLDGSDPEDVTMPEQIRKPFRWTESLNPADWEDPCSQEDVLCDEVQEGEHIFPILNIPGALYICNYGCAIRYFLIATGLSFGDVWMDRQADEDGLLQLHGEDGRPLGFLEWYERWLNEELSKYCLAT